VTAEQKQLATRIDALLIAVTALLWKVHGDAALLARMSDTALLSPQALSLLDDMETKANDAFVGQPDSTTGSVQGGVTQIHDELQLLATIEVGTVPRS
jgi:hypothetical protein